METDVRMSSKHVGPPSRLTLKESKFRIGIPVMKRYTLKYSISGELRDGVYTDFACHIPPTFSQQQSRLSLLHNLSPKVPSIPVDSRAQRGLDIHLNSSSTRSIQERSMSSVNEVQSFCPGSRRKQPCSAENPRFGICPRWRWRNSLSRPEMM
jgi:hypothetical protein